MSRLRTVHDPELLPCFMIQKCVKETRHGVCICSVLKLPGDKSAGSRPVRLFFPVDCLLHRSQMHTRELIWLVCTGVAWRSQGPHLSEWHNKPCKTRCGWAWGNKSGLKYNEWKNKHSAVVKELWMILVCWLTSSKQINAPVYITVLRCSYSLCLISLLRFHLPMVPKPAKLFHNQESLWGLSVSQLHSQKCTKSTFFFVI